MTESIGAQRQNREGSVLTDAGSDCSPVNNSGCSADAAAAAAAPIGTGQHFLNRSKGEGIVEGFSLSFFYYDTLRPLLCGHFLKRLSLSHCL